ncbi:DNA recombination protein RmuC [Sphingomonas segetis]|jgi:DNA recombination protein RmuC|uniref:DNA recombination protein RmuC n=1 Tax=Sphingomonas segetis TaxID=1104779 RepID=UPI0012D2F011|nr:DNA recombination protein RmuC [Sphingomonas segetis]
MDATAIAFVLVGLIVGAALGWLWASREAAGARQTVENLRLQLDEVVKERDASRGAVNELGALKAAQEERERSFAQQIEGLKDAKESLSAQFHEIASKLLGDARKSFLDQAGERFTQAVSPVETLLKTYQEKLQTIEKERVDHYAGLREAVELVRTGQGQVRDETRHLVNALRASPKARGRWGEQSLRNVLEQAGLSEHVDFQTEVSVDTGDGRLRPDVIVSLPGGRKLVIDAKCSLNAYLDACEEVDDEKRDACFRAHVASMRNHAQQLGSKSYWAQFGDAADYVIMYIPGEHFLAAALEQDPTLWDWAFERRVLLATPTNLVAIAKTVASIWRQERLAEAAQEIANLGKELHSRLATMNEHMTRVGKNLSTANSAYNQMVGSFESQVLTQAKRFETLGAGSAKTLDTPPMVEIAPRPLTKLAATPSNDDPPRVAAE